ncbi:MAG: response regulator [Candidatus Omnitrophica bacterium]|nr:response regulator [Candidatus Omnitrophota bacterium]
MATYKPKILVVDDEPDARQALAHSLRAKGYEVLEAAGGAEVLERAKAEWPTLIILDILLPDVAGTEVLDRLKKDPLTRAIPVLLLTAKPDVVEQIPLLREKSRQYRYVDKPERTEDLLAIVHNMLTGS